MSLQLVYWLSLGVGLGFLALSVAFDAFDFLDLDIAGNDVDAAPIFFAGLCAFGAGGLVGLHALGLGTFGSILTGVVTGLAFAVLTALLFLVLRRMESRQPFELRSLIGERGRCVLALEPGRPGRVSVNYDGMTRSLSATSPEPIAAGEEVVVSDVVGGTLSVVRSESLGLDRSGS